MRRTTTMQTSSAKTGCVALDVQDEIRVEYLLVEIHKTIVEIPFLVEDTKLTHSLGASSRRVLAALERADRHEV